MPSAVDRLRDTLALMKLVGQSPNFLQALGPLATVAKSESTVLLRGETGTGKELVARAVHYLSPRAGFPFVAVNCGAFSDTLLEDELFGHDKGAFTDAQCRRLGVVAQANNGTIFLDEVDALSRKAQVSVLRLLQEKCFRPVGASAEQHADVRIVVATNAPLEQLVKSGAFRADLYYRLAVFAIALPPLRERPEDILLLAQHFLKKHAPPGQKALSLSAAAQTALLAHDWPGNVRELENALIRGCCLCEGEHIEVGELGLPGFAGAVTGIAGGLDSLKASKQKVVEAFERDYLIRLLEHHQGNVTHAARTAKRDRRNLGRLLRKYRIEPRSFQRDIPASLLNEHF